MCAVVVSGREKSIQTILNAQVEGIKRASFDLFAVPSISCFHNNKDQRLTLKKCEKLYSMYWEIVEPILSEKANTLIPGLRKKLDKATEQSLSLLEEEASKFLAAPMCADWTNIDKVYGEECFTFNSLSRLKLIPKAVFNAMNLTIVNLNLVILSDDHLARLRLIANEEDLEDKSLIPSAAVPELLNKALPAKPDKVPPN